MSATKFTGPLAHGVLDHWQGPITFFCLWPPYPHSGPLAPKVLTPIRVMASVGRPCKSPKPLRGPSQIDLTKYPTWTKSTLQFHENHRFHYVGRAKWTLEIIDFHTCSQSLKPLENIENQNCSFFIRISTVLSSLDFPLTSFLPSTFPKKHKQNTSAKTPAFQKTSILPR